MNRPFFTVVTPSLNCGQYLSRNLESVRSQRLPPETIEHWVIDGGSNDGTVPLLERQSGINYVSEKDRGLSHAVNKGIEKARGDWVIWLNADDELAPEALPEFQKCVRSHPDVFVFCGRQSIHSYDGGLESITDPWDYNLGELLGSRTAISQASTFVHHSVYEKVGLMDESYRYAMDYEWLVRVMHHYRCQPIPLLLTRYHRRPGSIMDRGIADQYREFLRVRRRYRKSYLEPAEWRIRFYLMTDPLRKIPWLRRLVRQAKAIGGRPPRHVISSV